MTTSFRLESGRVVIKIGSSLATLNGVPRTAWLSVLGEEIARLRQRGCEIVLVASGAVALGRPLLKGLSGRKLEEKQAAAALGQPRLIQALNEAFGPHDVLVAQALLTLEDTETRHRWLTARATLDTLLKAGIVPVINENDTVATDEIRYGDNDRLGARVAQMIGAETLILLSDVDGLYTADPRRARDAAHVPLITDFDASFDAMAGGRNANAGIGSGGMITKLEAARIAWAAGCRTVITLGLRDHPISALEAGEKATWIVPPVSPETARLAWLSGHLRPEGTLFVDAGAVAALQRGASLLPVGITAVDGRFDRGAAVAVCGPDKVPIGKGVTAYGAVDIATIAGLQTEAAEAQLGYRGRPAIIHRNDLVLNEKSDRSS